jgi:hypothetical protein
MQLRVSQQRPRYGVLDDINGYPDVAIAKLPHTPNDNPYIIGTCRRQPRSRADSQQGPNPGWSLLIDALPSQLVVALISARLTILKRRRLPTALRKPSAPTQYPSLAKASYRFATLQPLPQHGPLSILGKRSCCYPSDVTHRSSPVSLFPSSIHCSRFVMWYANQWILG